MKIKVLSCPKYAIHLKCFVFVLLFCLSHDLFLVCEVSHGSRSADGLIGMFVNERAAYSSGPAEVDL
jgi:hypothetical protein